MFVVDDAETVRKLDPDFAAMEALSDVRGVYVTAPGDDGEHDIVSRCFAPRVGINEDPVTGSMHCVLSAYWCARLGKDELRAEQASARGGTMRVRLAGDRTLLAGSAVTVLAGELLV
jgi:PhzF family phenazine biosynthesis protein